MSHLSTKKVFAKLLSHSNLVNLSSVLLIFFLSIIPAAYASLNHSCTKPSDNSEKEIQLSVENYFNPAFRIDRREFDRLVGQCSSAFTFLQTAFIEAEEHYSQSDITGGNNHIIAAIRRKAKDILGNRRSDHGFYGVLPILQAIVQSDRIIRSYSNSLADDRNYGLKRQPDGLFDPGQKQLQTFLFKIINDVIFWTAGVANKHYDSPSIYYDKVVHCEHGSCHFIHTPWNQYPSGWTPFEVNRELAIRFLELVTVQNVTMGSNLVVLDLSKSTTLTAAKILNRGGASLLYPCPVTSLLHVSKTAGYYSCLYDAKKANRSLRHVTRTLASTRNIISNISDVHYHSHRHHHRICY